MENKYIVLDTETTGLNAAEDELLQVSIIDNEGTVIFDSYKDQHSTRSGQRRNVLIISRLKW